MLYGKQQDSGNGARVCCHAARMKESINYWTVACHQPRKDGKPLRLGDIRYLGADGQIRDYSAHCMIEDHDTALAFARLIAPDLQSRRELDGELVVEPVHILISCQEKPRLLRRVSQQSSSIKRIITQRALAML